MNKTININLGGFFFHIDESAYHKLNRYLEAISRSLSDDPQGKNEIISDIEARISELLSERITDARQVVNESDIDEIVNIMGQPEDYAEAEEDYAAPNYAYQRKTSTGKKLFRDGDDKFLGGVASGIAHYLEVDPIWIRLAIVALFFGAGFGILIYIILWILLPEAKTTAEKLQMEGEPVNIDNIEKKIRKEFTHVSENIKSTANKASEKIKDGAHEITEKVNSAFKKNQKKNNGLEDFLNTLGTIFMTLFKIVGKFIGLILIFASVIALISLIFGAFSVGSIGFLNIDHGFFNEFPLLVFESTFPKWLIATFVILLAGIPILLLLILGLRIVSSNVKKVGKTASLTLFGIWLIALFGIGFTGIELGTSKAYSGYKTERKSIEIVANDTLTIGVKNNDDLYFQPNVYRKKKKIEVYEGNQNMLYSNYVKVDIQQTNNDEAYLEIRKSSEGKNRRVASESAATIKYNYSFTKDVLTLDAFFLSNPNHLIKDETVYVTIYLPENASIYLKDGLETFLNNVDNTTDIYDADMVSHYFIMTSNGLTCTDCIMEQ